MTAPRLVWLLSLVVLSWPAEAAFRSCPELTLEVFLEIANSQAVREGQPQRGQYVGSGSSGDANPTWHLEAPDRNADQVLGVDRHQTVQASRSEIRGNYAYCIYGRSTFEAVYRRRLGDRTGWVCNSYRHEGQQGFNCTQRVPTSGVAHGNPGSSLQVERGR